jgi:hypothetical protein
MPRGTRRNLLAKDLLNGDVRVRNKDNAFKIDGVQYKSKTAALPQQFLGFQ